LIVNTFFGEISGWQQTPRQLALRVLGQVAG
jgi:hypothetical protein